MAQHKKKPTRQQLQKLAKAQHRNNFFRKLKYICNTCSGEDIYSLFPADVLEIIYENRHHSLKVYTAKDHVVPNEVSNSIKHTIAYMLKVEKATMMTNGPEILLNDFLTIVLTIIHLFRIVQNVDFPDYRKIQAALYKFTNDVENDKKVSDKFYWILQTYGFMFSDLTKSLYWMKHQIKPFNDGASGIHNFVEIHSMVPETISVKIDGIERPDTRMGWAMLNTGPDWITLKPSVLNRNGPFAEIPVNVYVQSHAFNRMEERIDCFPPFVLHMYLYDSFRNPRVFYDHNNDPLIEFRLQGIKAGYFRVVIVEGVIVVRTFLFVTNNGTPEGRLLEKNTGLQKLDKKFLAIDKLSTFMTSDFRNNDEVRKIFLDAGCQCLLDLYEQVDSLCLKHPEQSVSGLMLNYLQYNFTPVSASGLPPSLSLATEKEK